MKNIKITFFLIKLQHQVWHERRAYDHTLSASHDPRKVQLHAQEPHRLHRVRGQRDRVRAQSNRKHRGARLRWPCAECRRQAV